MQRYKLNAAFNFKPSTSIDDGIGKFITAFKLLSMKILGISCFYHDSAATIG